MNMKHNNNHKTYTYNDKKPVIADSAFIAPGAKVIGDVSIKDRASIWYNAVVRADLAPVKIGENTNIQENCSLHVDIDVPVILGDNITIGHGAIIHGSRIEDNCLIGMGATILNNAVIGENTIIGAGALVTEGKNIAPGSLVLGVPGKVIRKLNEKEIEEINDSAAHYARLAHQHQTDLSSTN